MKTKIPKPVFMYSPTPALEPKPGCWWADTMVLNPAIVKDPTSDTIHMLFRATGPCPEKRARPSCVEPYPIFLGYAKSDDLGKTWDADFSRPALAPALEYEIDKIYIKDDEGQTVVNYANGCIEDPRIFEIEGQWYVSVACRMFPPGPYWEEKRRGETNQPLWQGTEQNPFGQAASWNETTTVLYRLDLPRLIARDYDRAFTYVCHLTNPEVSDNRDVFVFPEKMKINGKLQYVMLHRPQHPDRFPEAQGVTKPSIMIAAAERIKDLAGPKATHRFFAKSLFDWEGERIAPSWGPIKLGKGEWLIQNHGKTWPGHGYSQSFMILKEKKNDLPVLAHRCAERMMNVTQKWEMPDLFSIPCIFTTGGIVIGDDLIISYGAADQKVGISRVNFRDVVRYVRTFDAQGKRDVNGVS